MHTVGCRGTIAAFCLAVMAAGSTDAQPRPQRDTVLAARRDSLERELEKVAVIDRKLMVPMRDGAKMQFDVYRPKNVSGPVPAIFVRTPYNMNSWDVSRETFWWFPEESCSSCLDRATREISGC